MKIKRYKRLEVPSKCVAEGETVEDTILDPRFWKLEYEEVEVEVEEI